MPQTLLGRRRADSEEHRGTNRKKKPTSIERHSPHSGHMWLEGMAVAFFGMWKKGGVRLSLRDPGSVFLTLQEEMFGDGGYGERSRLEADAWMSLAFRGSPGNRMGREEGWGEGTLCPTPPLSGSPT